MAHCWYCEVELKAGVNTSREHIIPDSLGGRLTSYELLCSLHNSILGDRLDAPLYKQVAPFIKLINPVRDRPDDSFIDLIKDSGERTKRRSGFKPFYPVEMVLPDQKITTSYFKDQEEAQGFIKRKIIEFERKGKRYKVEHIHREPSVSQLIVANQIGTNLNIFGGKLILKSLSKIIINYYLFQGGEKRAIKPLIDVVKDNNIDAIANYARIYYTDLPFHQLLEDEMSHIIYIKGDIQKKVLFAYIEIFNFINALLVIDTNYTGESFEYQYCYDLIKSKPFPKKIIIDKPKDFFLHFPVLKFGSNHYKGQILFNRFTTLLSKYQNVFMSR